MRADGPPPRLAVGRRRVALGLALLATAPAHALSGLAAPLRRPALQTPRALDAVLLDVARAGERLVAVGERGIALVSDDAGAHWHQAAVPTSVTLTATSFATPRTGWAVGHSGVVLATRDGGDNWSLQLDGERAAGLVLQAAQALPAGAAGRAEALAHAEQLVADGPDKPCLAVHFLDTRRGLVAGAYGLLFYTEDAGTTWQPWLDRAPNPKSLHFNAIAAHGDTVVIAGEQGLLLRSDDAGRQFRPLASPYAGSWFAAAFLPGGRLLLAGLRGHAYWSDDRGASFTQAHVPQPVSIGALTVLGDGTVLALNQAGQVLHSRDRGAGFALLPLPPGAPLTQAVELAPGRLAGASLRGMRTFSLTPPAKSS